MDRSIPWKGRVRLPAPGPLLTNVVEICLLALLSLQVARFSWITLAPMQPLGAWRQPESVSSIVTPLGSEGSLDPFTRQGKGAASPPTEFSTFKLFGIREGNMLGPGAAVIAGSDGQQRSYVVGEEITPGIRLKAVQADHVTIGQGAREQEIYFENSAPVSVANRSMAVSLASAGDKIPPPAAARAADLLYSPRFSNGQITGIIVQPDKNGGALGAIGLAVGDVIVSVNGEKITSVENALTLANQLRAGEAHVQVERNGRLISLSLRNP